MDYCLIILNCFKYDHKRKQQLDTWLKRSPIRLFFHIRGIPDQEKEYIINPASRIITVKTLDNYESLTKKTYLAIKAIRETFPHITHIIKTDDDEDCNLGKLTENLEIIKKYDYGGGYCVWLYEDRYSEYHYHSCSIKEPTIVKASNYFIGRFYFVSAYAADIILSKKSEIWDLMFEDNAVGYALNDIPPEKRIEFPDKEIFFEYEEMK